MWQLIRILVSFVLELIELVLEGTFLLRVSKYS